MELDAPAAAERRRNAHEDSLHFAQELLKDDRLGPSVCQLVMLLRETIKIVEELDRLVEAGNGSDKFDVIVKAAGWYRIQYSSPRFEFLILKRIPNRANTLFVDYSLVHRTTPLTFEWSMERCF